MNEANKALEQYMVKMNKLLGKITNNLIELDKRLTKLEGER